MLDGVGIGSELNIDAVGPEHHELEHIRGKKLTISLTIHKIQRIESAEVSDVYPRYGFPDEELSAAKSGEPSTTACKVNNATPCVSRPPSIWRRRSTLSSRTVDRTTVHPPDRTGTDELASTWRLTNDEIEGQRLADLRDAATDETRRRLKLLLAGPLGRDQRSSSHRR